MTIGALGIESEVGTSGAGDPYYGHNDMDDTRVDEATTSRRSLGAILITDAAGFSSLASRDEPRALEQLRADMEVMKSCSARFGGRVIKSTGDGYLMFFDSAVHAVNCAMDIQAAMAVRTGEGLFQHRIGVHLGDVVLTDDDAYGDGVNVAARLQEGATPGTIWISQTVYDVIRGKVACRSVFEGDKSLKGLAARVPVWSVAPGEGTVGGPRRHTPAWALIATPVLLIVAVTLAVMSAQVQTKAAEEVRKANQERDDLLHVLQEANGGVPYREMQFNELKNVLERSSVPQDPGTQNYVRKLDGLNEWKGWIGTRLQGATAEKPVQIVRKTSAGTTRSTLWANRNKGLTIKEGDKVRNVRLEDLDPETLGEVSLALGNLEPAFRRGKVITWVKDLKDFYAKTGPGKVPQVGTVGPSHQTPPVSGSDIDKKVSAAMGEAKKKLSEAGVKTGDGAETPATTEPPPGPPKTTAGG